MKGEIALGSGQVAGCVDGAGDAQDTQALGGHGGNGGTEDGGVGRRQMAQFGNGFGSALGGDSLIRRSVAD